ncbi:unnamed protein product [Umbelopsis ramanniana]
MVLSIYRCHARIPRSIIEFNICTSCSRGSKRFQNHHYTSEYNYLFIHIGVGNCQRHGRRIIYIAATVIYVGSTIGCALSPNIAVFIALRITQSAGASAAQAVGAGTITDIFSANERGSAMGLFFLGPLIGPVLGPLLGGYINQYFGWRMIFWILTAMGGLVLIFIILFLPETSRKHIMAHQKKQTNPAEDTVGPLNSEVTLAVPEKSTSKALDPTYEKFSVGLVRPLKFLMKPVVILSSLPYALAFGFMYFIISTLPHQLEYKYNFNTGQIGLAYLSNGIGNAMGAVFGGQYSDWFVARQVRKSPDGRKIPEMRIGAMWIGIVMIPLGDLIYGWCLQDRTSVWLVLFGFFITGLGVGIVQTPSNTYLVDAYHDYPASVVSASNLMRCTWAACTPLFAPMFIAAVGNGIALTVVAIISALSGICVLVVQRHGEAMRAKDHRL